MNSGRMRWLVGAVVLGGLACAGDGTAGLGPDDGNEGEAGLEAAVQPIFTSSCAFAGCHGGSSPAQGLNLSAGQAWSNLVNVQSTESPLVRVAPGQPDDSYLVHKVQGTQASVGGTGGRMPLGGAALTASQIETIRAWITDGAQDN